jgi:uncharacterized membrane protein
MQDTQPAPLVPDYQATEVAILNAEPVVSQPATPPAPEQPTEAASPAEAQAATQPAFQPVVQQKVLPAEAVLPTDAALPDTGFGERAGIPGLLGATIGLLVVIFLARRLRSAK